MEDTRHIRLYLNPTHSFDFAATDHFFLLDMHEAISNPQRSPLSKHYQTVMIDSSILN